MSKKALIFGLFVALLASSVGGAFEASNAQAAYPYGDLTCSPSVQSVVSGGYVSFSSYYLNVVTPYGGQLTWTAVGGTPSYGTGSTFGTQFNTGSSYETRYVTVTDGLQSATCTVSVNGYGYWTPTPTPYSTLYCAPSYSTANSGDLVTFTAWGGNGSYSWTTSDGTPSSGWGSSFASRFYNYGSYAQNRSVTVTSAGQSASCTVAVNASSYWTPTPTPVYGWFSMSHSVQNVTRGTSGSSVTVYAGDRVQFVTTITTGNQQVVNFRAADTLPSYTHYVSGSTTVNGTWYSDIITTGGLSLGTLAANRTYTIRFDATVDSYAGNYYSTLTNSMTATADSLTSQTLTTNLVLNGYGYWTPTPTPYSTPSTRVELTSAGRNVTRGQSGENASVRARGGDTLDLIVRVRSTDSAYLSNVYVTDVLPSGVQYVAGSTTLNGYVVGDGITSSGISIGSIAPGSVKVVKFSVRVDGAYLPTVGSVVVSNVAQVRADNLSTMSVQLPITMGQNLYISAVSSVKTGPADSLWLALLVAMLVTGAYAAYTRTDLFGRRMALAEVAALSRTSTMNFSR